MVLISLVGMLVGILRCSGALDFAGNNFGSNAGSGVESNDGANNHRADVSVGAMTGSGKLLLFGGLTLAVIGMLYGLQYALFTEHQTLDHMGGYLAQSFTAAASRNASQSQAALEEYRETKYDYVRQVDAHSHEVGLAMLMMVLGVIFERVNFREGIRRLVALSLLAGGALFPVAVLLQTYHHDAIALKGLAVAGSGLVIAALAAAAWGFARPRAAAQESRLN
jgi:hypothetical protein